MCAGDARGVPIGVLPGGPIAPGPRDPIAPGPRDPGGGIVPDPIDVLVIDMFDPRRPRSANGSFLVFCICSSGTLWDRPTGNNIVSIFIDKK